MAQVGSKGEGTIRGAAALESWPGSHGTMYPFLYTIEVEGGDQFGCKANHKTDKPRFSDGEKVSFEITGQRDGNFEGRLDRAGFTGGGGGGGYSAPASKAAGESVEWSDIQAKYAELIPFVKAQLIGAGLEADSAAVNAGVATIMIQAERLNVSYKAGDVPF
jgi:hypothetical protein